MADNSKIEWTEATWNPQLGCTKVSPGCDHCYVIRVAARFDRTGSKPSPFDGTTDGDGDWSGQVNVPNQERLTQPLRWKRPRRIFVNSLSDLFHDAVPTCPDDCECRPSVSVIAEFGRLIPKSPSIEWRKAARARRRHAERTGAQTSGA